MCRLFESGIIIKKGLTLFSMIFDMHVHMFPDFLAPKALSGIGETSHVPPVTKATLSDTRTRLKEWGISGAAVLNIATRPEQQTNVNNWAAEVQDDFFYCFGSVHPDAPDAVEELWRIRGLGLFGVKLHPEYQRFFVDDKKAYPVYDALQELGLPVTFHAGWDPVSPHVVHTPPKALAKVARDFPRMTVIAAHMGGMRRSEEAEEYLIGMENVYLDTSMSYLLIDPEQAKRMILHHGSERVLYASDCPWSLPKEQMRFLERLGLPDRMLEDICWNNARRLLGLDKISGQKEPGTMRRII
ncbi:MAG: amidohydrolase [[Clostridium] sporosphaeroides]|uniref:Amidohydrolase n=2 Tax=Faecalispora sporosphaeroides TaxID=1549 RepID=A0A928Q2L0_9FIRM|nr:amidohydrolase [Faecalispora sporosphaeroides]